MRRLIIAIGAALLGSGSTKRMEGENKYNEGLRLFYGEGELEKGIAALRDFVEDSKRGEYPEYDKTYLEDAQYRIKEFEDSRQDDQKRDWRFDVPDGMWAINKVLWSAAAAIAAYAIVKACSNVNRVIDAVEIEDFHNNTSGFYRPAAVTHIEGLAKQLINLVYAIDRLLPEEKELMLKIDQEKIGGLFTELVKAKTPSAMDVLLSGDKFDQVLIEEVDAAQKLKIKEILKDAAGQITPFQENVVGNDIIKRVFPRGQGENRTLRKGVFDEALKTFNNKASETFEKVIVSLHNEDFCQKLVQDLIQDFCTQIDVEREDSLRLAEQTTGGIEPKYMQKFYSDSLKNKFH